MAFSARFWCKKAIFASALFASHSYLNPFVLNVNGFFGGKKNSIAEKKELLQIECAEKRKNIEITIYMVYTCPIGSQATAILDHLKIPYRVVLVNPLFSEIESLSQKETFNSRLNSPVIIFNKVLYSSVDIFTKSLIEYLNSCDLNLNLNVDEKELTKWNNWIQQSLVPVFDANISKSFTDSLQSLEYLDTHFCESSEFKLFITKYVSAIRMTYFKSQSVQAYSEEPFSSLENNLLTWSHACKNSIFHGGDKPDIIDWFVYGAIRSKEKTATMKNILRLVNNKWWFEMNELAGNSYLICDK